MRIITETVASTLILSAAAMLQDVQGKLFSLLCSNFLRLIYKWLSVNAVSPNIDLLRKEYFRNNQNTSIAWEVFKVLFQTVYHTETLNQCAFQPRPVYYDAWSIVTSLKCGIKVVVTEFELFNHIIFGKSTSIQRNISYPPSRFLLSAYN